MAKRKTIPGRCLESEIIKQLGNRVDSLEEHSGIWASYSTDGDAGWYHVRLHTTKQAALAAAKEHKGYGEIARLRIE